MSNIEYKKHHYLPQGILRNFGFGKKHAYIFRIDKKHDSRIINTNIKNIACKTGFYDFDSDNNSLEVDFFGEIDCKAPKALKKLLSNPYVPLDKQYRSDINRYVASQIIRTLHAYNNLTNICDMFKSQISEDTSLLVGNVSPKDFFLDEIKKTTQVYEEILSRLSFTTYISQEMEFVIGDNPVMIFEHDGKLIMQDNKLPAIKGKVFMMPVSPKNIIIYYDQTCIDKETVLKYVSGNNFWQFANAAQYIFSHNSNILQREIKEHYNAAYDYIMNTNPEIISAQRIKKGDAIYIAQHKYRLEGNALEKIKTIFNEQSPPKAPQPTNRQQIDNK